MAESETIEFVQEDSGRLKFLCYSNDGVDEHMIWFVALLTTLLSSMVLVFMNYVSSQVSRFEEYLRSAASKYAQRIYCAPCHG